MCSTDGNQPRRTRFEIAGSATPIDAARVRTSRARRRAVARCGEARGASLLPRVVRPSPYGRRVPAWKYLDPVQPTPSVPAIPPTPSEALAGPGAATAQDCLFAVGPRRTGSAARLVAGVLWRPPVRPPHHAGRGRGRHRTNHRDARSHSLNVFPSRSYLLSPQRSPQINRMPVLWREPREPPRLSEPPQCRGAAPPSALARGTSSGLRSDRPGLEPSASAGDICRECHGRTATGFTVRSAGADRWTLHLPVWCWTRQPQRFPNRSG